MTPAPPRPAEPPSLGALFACFFRIGAMSFGGGMSAWIRREVVERRGWLDDRQFLSGLALSQISPGANGVNLAVFVGTLLRGTAGAAAAFAGMTALPALLVLGLGAIYAEARGVPGGQWFGALLGGVGAAAIGLNLANGVRLSRRNVRSVAAALVTAATAISVGLLRWHLLPVLAVMIPVSLGLTLLERQR